MTEKEFEQIKALKENIENLKRATKINFNCLACEKEDYYGPIVCHVKLDQVTCLRVHGVLKERLKELQDEFERL